MSPKSPQVRVECAFDAIAPLDTLKPNPANPNRHSEQQIALLAKIIKAQGWRNPIVVSNRSGLVTKGHARLTAAQRLGLPTAPVDFQDYATQSEESADTNGRSNSNDTLGNQFRP